MSNPDLPAELLDHTVDLLQDDTDALKSCCLVSKSWIPRARRYLFADVKLNSPVRLEAWKNAFPSPSTSPACYAKTLCIRFLVEVHVTDAQEGGWIPTFSRVEHLEVGAGSLKTPLALFHGFSPKMKSLRVNTISLPFSRISNLIFSFPFLEDLSIDAHYGLGPEDDYQLATTRPSSSPPFTGSLNLFIWGGTDRFASELLALPGGLRFRELRLSLTSEEDVSSSIALVEECSSTLESLEITSHVNARPPGLIDLSKATKLRSVAFASESEPRLITMALQTITRNHQSFQQLSIGAASILDSPNLATIKSKVGEAGYLGWLELDRFLAQLHELRSIRPKVVFRGDRQRARSCAELLLPETGGIVDLENSLL